MPRNSVLPELRLRTHWQHHPVVSDPHRTTGAIAIFNPTHAVLRPHDFEDRKTIAATGLHWRARDNRKGRHTLLVPRDSVDPKRDSTTVFHGIARMLVAVNYWDISWLVAVIFTLGSVVWCINGFMVYLPLVRPGSVTEDEETYGGGITAFIGATVFEIGSYLLVLEAINENQTACFGWALEKVLEGDDRLRPVPDRVGCVHHHHRVFKDKTLCDTGYPRPSAPKRHSGMGNLRRNGSSQLKWVWWPSNQYLKTHLIHEIGFIASMAQFIGATVFWISGVTSLPGGISEGSQGVRDGVFWTPQVVGGLGFIVSGFLFMIETQEKWYKPAPDTLGWHVGFWNLIGAVGFTMCGALGFSTDSKLEYQSTLATFWGSWTFLIASLAQWYEAVNKYPTEGE